MSDPTLEILERFKRPGDWDGIKRNVPIFMEHEAYEVDGQLQVIVPGEKKPKGRFLYRIGKDELEGAAEAINSNIRKYGKTVVGFLGHTKKGKDQLEQPPMVCVYGEAKVGRWGPQKLWGLLSDQYTLKGSVRVPDKNNPKGYYEVPNREIVNEFPNRSIEFYPGSNEVTAVALLKTDPRLPMGTITYERGKIDKVFYQRGFPMADKLPSDPAAPPDANAGAALPPGLVDALIAELVKRFPQLSEPAPATMGGPGEPDGDEVPMTPPDDAKDKELKQMSRELSEIKKRQQELVVSAARANAKWLLDLAKTHGVKYERSIEEDRMLKMGSDAERESHYKHMMRFYQKAPVSTDRDWVDTPKGLEGGDSVPDDLTPEQTERIRRYGESNGIDISTDEGWEKALAAVAKKK